MGLVALLAAEKQSEASQPSSDEPNAALKVAFKVAQFAYYAVILARYAGDALKLALAGACAYRSGYLLADALHSCENDCVAGSTIPTPPSCRQGLFAAAQLRHRACYATIAYC
jgi:hypothetical protein